MRKMASIRKVDNLIPIEGADKIEVATVGGWKTVVKKGEFKVGDLGVYFEIDSKVPDIPEFEFLRDKKFIVRTVKLRGQLSQGLLLPLIKFDLVDVREGDDVSDQLGVTLYEPPVDFSRGDMKGNFPHFIRKTDQERIQNLSKEIEEWRDIEFEVTEKLEGSSTTWYLDDGEFGVCSRNYEMKAEYGSWDILNKKLGIEENLRKLGRNIAIQAELIGPKIQGNIYNLNEPTIKIFDIYDIDNQCYMSAKERISILEKLNLSDHTVPTIGFFKIGTKSTDELLKMAEGVSVLGAPRREGLVWKAGDISFKVINNEYLSDLVRENR